MVRCERRNILIGIRKENFVKDNPHSLVDQGSERDLKIFADV